MLSQFTLFTNTYLSEAFSGKAITTPIEDRWGFRVNVTLNSALIHNYSKYEVDGFIRLVFHTPIQGSLYVKRAADVNSVVVFGLSQGEAYWEKFYDSLVQCLQDEALRRYDTEKKQIGFYTNMPFIHAAPSVAEALQELYTLMRTMPLDQENRLWRPKSSFGWVRNAQTTPISQTVTQSISDKFWQYPKIEVSQGELTQNKLLGISQIDANRFSFLKSITGDKVILYRYMWNPLEPASILSQIKTGYTQGIIVWGARRIVMDVDDRKDVIILNKVSEDSIDLSTQSEDDVNSLTIRLDNFQVPMVMTFYRADEGIYE